MYPPLSRPGELQSALPVLSQPSIPPSITHSHSLAEQGAKPSCGDLQKKTLSADFDPRQKQDVDAGRLFEQDGRWPQ